MKENLPVIESSSLVGRARKWDNYSGYHTVEYNG